MRFLWPCRTSPTTSKMRRTSWRATSEQVAQGQARTQGGALRGAAGAAGPLHRYGALGDGVVPGAVLAHRAQLPGSPGRPTQRAADLPRLPNVRGGDAMRHIKRAQWEAFLAPFRAIANPDSDYADEWIAHLVTTNRHMARIYRVHCERVKTANRRHA